MVALALAVVDRIAVRRARLVSRILATCSGCVYIAEAGTIQDRGATPTAGSAACELATRPIGVSVADACGVHSWVAVHAAISTGQSAERSVAPWQALTSTVAGDIPMAAVETARRANSLAGAVCVRRDYAHKVLEFIAARKGRLRLLAKIRT